MTYQKFHSGLAAGNIRPIYLFAGKEDYLAENGVNALIERLLTGEQRDFNLSVYYGKDADALSNALASPPVFADRRVTVVKHAHELAGNALEAVARYIDNPPRDGCLILWAGEVDKRKSFARRLEGKIDPIVCGPLKSGELKKWTVDHLAAAGKKLDDEALGRILSVHWPSLRDLAGELDRLMTMVGDAPIIKAADVDEMGGGSYAFEVWRIGDAIIARDRAASITALRNLTQWNVKPAQIIGDLFRLFQRLLIVRWFADRNQLSKAKEYFGGGQFLVQKFSGQIKNIPQSSIENGINLILDADLNIKRGLVSAETAIPILVTSLVKVLSSKRAAA